MEQRKSINSRWIWVAVKLLIAALAVFFIYHRVFRQEHTIDFIFQLRPVWSEPPMIFAWFTIIVLMFFNWLIEAVKWRLMIRKIEPLSLRKSFYAVLSGITISFFTPNRIGEYAGRVFHLREGKRIKATLITILENSSQLLATIVAGGIASIIFFHSYVDIPFPLWVALVLLICVFCGICLLLYFNISFLQPVLMRLFRSDKWKDYAGVVALYSRRELLVIFSLACSRYLIFSSQFFILLRIFEMPVAIGDASLLIAMTYLTMVFIPSFVLAELGVRGAVATYFFQKVAIDLLPVLNATFTLWLVNLALPALAGAVCILSFRLGKTSTA